VLFRCELLPIGGESPYEIAESSVRKVEQHFGFANSPEIKKVDKNTELADNKIAGMASIIKTDYNIYYLKFFHGYPEYL